MNIRKIGLVLLVLASIVVASCGGGQQQQVVVQEVLAPDALVGRVFNAQWSTVVGRDVDTTTPSFMTMDYDYTLTFVDVSTVTLDTSYTLVPDTNNNAANLQPIDEQASLSGTYTLAGDQVTVDVQGVSYALTYTFGAMTLSTQVFMDQLLANGFNVDNWPSAITFYPQTAAATTAP